MNAKMVELLGVAPDELLGSIVGQDERALIKIMIMCKAAEGRALAPHALALHVRNAGLELSIDTTGQAMEYERQRLSLRATSNSYDHERLSYEGNVESYSPTDSDSSGGGPATGGKGGGPATGGPDTSGKGAAIDEPKGQEPTAVCMTP